MDEEQKNSGELSRQKIRSALNVAVVVSAIVHDSKYCCGNTFLTSTHMKLLSRVIWAVGTFSELGFLAINYQYLVLTHLVKEMIMCCILKTYFARMAGELYYCGCDVLDGFADASESQNDVLIALRRQSSFSESFSNVS